MLSAWTTVRLREGIRCVIPQTIKQNTSATVVILDSSASPCCSTSFCAAARRASGS